MDVPDEEAKEEIPLTKPPDTKFVLEGIIEGTSDLIGAVDSRLRATAFNSALGTRSKKSSA
jgi:hypothetical protein